MYCAPCRTERLGTSRHCAVCGDELISRPEDVLRAELMHVLWALEDVPSWDGTSVPPRARGYVIGRYKQKEHVLRTALEERVEPAPRTDAVVAVPSPPAPPVELPAAVVETPPPPQAAAPLQDVAREEVQAVEAYEERVPEPAAASAVAALFTATAAAPSVDDEVVERASVWHRIWKPFLHESVGWFIGGFLILAGTLYWVADAWAGMSGTTRSLTVFAFAGAWTLGFAAWARFLSRRETTRSAGRVLLLIAGAVAPLAPVALGPIVSTAPLLFWPALAAWSALAFALGRSVSRAYDPAGGPWTAATLALTAAVMGAAPVLASSSSGVWLAAAPLLAYLASSRIGPRETTAQTVFAALAPLYLLVLFSIRLHLALTDAHTLPPLGTWAPFLAAALLGALQLRGTTARADAWSVGTVGAQVALVVAAATGAAPALFLTSAVLFATALHLSRRDARWLYPGYAGAYFAFQTCGQLVPAQLKLLLASVREALGYAASQPLPAAYDAVYAAVFVVAGGLFALRAARKERPYASVLLACTAWASALVGLAGLESIVHDARPALWSAPALAALCLFLGMSLGRVSLSRVGAGVSLVAGAALYATFGAVPVAALALGLAALSLVALKGHREALSAASGVLALVAATLAFWPVAGAGGLLTLAMASAAALLVARNLDSREGLVLASFGPALLLPKLVLVVAPELFAVSLGVAGALLAGVARRDPSTPLRAGSSRARAALPAAWTFALLAPVVQLTAHAVVPGLLGATLLLAAVTMLLGPRTAFGDGVAIVAFALAAIPFGGALQPLPFMTPSLVSLVAFAAAAGAAYSAWEGDRHTWRSALIASLAVVLGLSTGHFAVAALTALVASRALLPAIGVPVAAVLAALATEGHGPQLLVLAVAFAALGLLEEFDFTWAHLLGRRGIAWPASVSSALLWLAAGVFFPYTLAWAACGAGCALLWTRATRWPLLAAAIPLMFLWNLQVLPAVVAVVALSRALQHSTWARRALLGERHARFAWVQGALAGALAAGGAYVCIAHGAPALPFAVALLLCAGAPTWWRVVAAAGFALFVPGLPVLAAVVLLGVALLARHRPVAAQWLLGGADRTWTVSAAALSAVGCAAWAATLEPSSFALAAALAVTLALCAVLLGWRWMLTAAVLALALPLSLVARPMLSYGGSLTAGLVVLGVAALAAVLRHERIGGEALRGLARVGHAFDGPVATPLWLGAALALPVVLVLGAPLSAVTVAAAAALLVTGVAWEAAVASMLLVGAVALAAPPGLAAAAVAATGLLLCVGGVALEKRHAVGRVWHHAGWALALPSLVLLRGLDFPETPVTLALLAGCAWAVAVRRPKLEWLAWAGTLAAAHVGLFFAGLKLGHGQPHELILPWTALVSAALGAVALGVRGSSKQRVAAGIATLTLSMLELAAGALLLEGPLAREAGVAAVAMAVVGLAFGRYALAEDDPVVSLLTQLACALGFVAVRWLGFGHGPGTVEAFAALGFGAVLGGAAGALKAGGKEEVASAARLGAAVWPLLGFFAAPFAQPWVVGGLLLAQSACFAVLARGGAWRRRFATLSTLCFNGALAFACLAAHFHSPHYLLIPVGLSALVLLNLFSDDFAPETLQRLRACAVTVIYAAAAFEPLAFPAPWALWLCAVVCVAGVAVGIALKVRSYVFLGTGFLVTTVVASLARYGIQQPRVGALLLSALGLLIVGFMVLVTTRRAELLERYARARSMLAQWQG